MSIAYFKDEKVGIIHAIIANATSCVSCIMPFEEVHTDLIKKYASLDKERINYIKEDRYYLKRISSGATNPIDAKMLYEVSLMEFNITGKVPTLETYIKKYRKDINNIYKRLPEISMDSFKNYMNDYGIEKLYNGKDIIDTKDPICALLVICKDSQISVEYDFAKALDPNADDDIDYISKENYLAYFNNSSRLKYNEVIDALAELVVDKKYPSMRVIKLSDKKNKDDNEKDMSALIEVIANACYYPDVDKKTEKEKISKSYISIIEQTAYDMINEYLLILDKCFKNGEIINDVAISYHELTKSYYDNVVNKRRTRSSADDDSDVYGRFYVEAPSAVLKVVSCVYRITSGNETTYAKLRLSDIYGIYLNYLYLLFIKVCHDINNKNTDEIIDNVKGAFIDKVSQINPDVLFGITAIYAIIDNEANNVNNIIRGLMNNVDTENLLMSENSKEIKESYENKIKELEATIKSLQERNEQLQSKIDSLQQIINNSEKTYSSKLNKLEKEIEANKQELADKEEFIEELLKALEENDGIQEQDLQPTLWFTTELENLEQQYTLITDSTFIRDMFADNYNNVKVYTPAQASRLTSTLLDEDVIVVYSPGFSNHGDYYRLKNALHGKKLYMMPNYSNEGKIIQFLNNLTK